MSATTPLRIGQAGQIGVRLSPRVKSVDQDGRTMRSLSLEESYLRRGMSLTVPLVASKECCGQPLHQRLLDILLQPNQSFVEAETPTIANLFTVDEMIQIITQARSLLAEDDTLAYVSAPCRVVSDLHGQYADLMRIWGWFGAPDGSISWVFLGDYVDRTAYSCEVVLLLYALKIKWPKKILLLRGNHEISSTNAYYGFKDELVQKWGLVHGMMLFQAFNDSFDYLPLAAVATAPGCEGEPEPCSNDNTNGNTQESIYNGLVPQRYLLVHGGIGRLHSLSQISSVQRPVRPGLMSLAEQIMLELVWSDPAPNDDDNGLICSKRDNYSGSIVCFGADRVRDFCQRNHITAILRGHECVHEGLELAFGGRVVTFFTAVNYTGNGDNHGCILHLSLTEEDADGRPSIEVQPIRIEARPRWRLPTYRRRTDDGDITNAEFDQDTTEENAYLYPQARCRSLRSIYVGNGSQVEASTKQASQPDQSCSVGTGETCKNSGGLGLASILELSTAAMRSLHMSSEKPETSCLGQHRHCLQVAQDTTCTAQLGSGTAATCSPRCSTPARGVPATVTSDNKNAFMQALMQMPYFQEAILSWPPTAQVDAASDPEKNTSTGDDEAVLVEETETRGRRASQDHDDLWMDVWDDDLAFSSDEDSAFPPQPHHKFGGDGGNGIRSMPNSLEHAGNCGLLGTEPSFHVLPPSESAQRNCHEDVMTKASMNDRDTEGWRKKNAQKGRQLLSSCECHPHTEPSPFHLCPPVADMCCAAAEALHSPICAVQTCNESDPAADGGAETEKAPLRNTCDLEAASACTSPIGREETMQAGGEGLGCEPPSPALQAVHVETVNATGLTDAAT